MEDRYNECWEQMDIEEWIQQIKLKEKMKADEVMENKIDKLKGK